MVVGPLGCLLAVRWQDGTPERGTRRVGSEENGTVGWTCRGAQRLGDHNCSHGNGDGGDPAVRGDQQPAEPESCGSLSDQRAKTSSRLS
jgi:hypothetical protein